MMERLSTVTAGPESPARTTAAPRARRTWLVRFGAAFVFAVLASLAIAVARAEDSGKNVILIGWDGSQRNHVNEMLDRNELPTLAALAKEGSKVDIDVVTGATDTKAGWTQILTGYAPDKSGVYSNGKYQPIPAGYTILERVEKALGADNVVTKMIVGKKGHVDADAPQKIPYEKWAKNKKNQQAIDKRQPGLGDYVKDVKIIEENGQKYAMTPGKPYSNTKDHIDLFVNGLVENDKVGETAIKNLDELKGKRFLFFVHFADPDHTGHKSGENSQEYSNALKSDDEWTGKIIAKLKELGLYDKTLVYVVVDHGFNEGEKGHSYAPFVFAATNDKQVTRKAGTREDIAPTVLKRFGIDLASLQPTLDGVPLDEPAPARKALEQRSATAAAGKKGAAPKAKVAGDQAQTGKGKAPLNAGKTKLGKSKAKSGEDKANPAPKHKGTGRDKGAGHKGEDLGGEDVF